MTFVMVTHDQDEALALSDHVAVFCQGNLEQLGSPQEIYDNPKTSFVAKFIGRTNLLTGSVVESNSAHCKISIVDGLVLSVPLVGGLAPGQEVTLWMKPHSVVLFDATDGASGDNSFEGVVINKSYQGTTTEYVVRAYGIEMRTSTLNTTALASRFCAGDAVRIQLPASSLNVLSQAPAREPALRTS
jgi:spermidine/putrescine transport system ATP-binding protein